MVDYTLIRSRRRTVALYVRDHGVEVRAPLLMPVSEIDSFVASKERWIADKLAKVEERIAARESFSLDYGDLVLYRGRLFSVVAREGVKVGFDDDCFFVPPGLEPDQMISACVQVYRMLAKRYLVERPQHFAGVMGVAPAAVRVSGAHSRWGSCSAKGSINYSWRLIMADDDVIDYVIVHELVHLAEMNHSARFWQEVEGVLPDYRDRKARLQELQLRLSRENWR
ncbi:MAG: M48 family metallopeptidase [Coriobacteriia bacterium]|nr:M48 family metallopeptidase [Coriobacteriia bacterium]